VVEPSPHLVTPYTYQNAIECALVDDCVERICKVHRSHIHLQIFEVGPFLFVFLVHSFGDCLADVDIGDSLISLVKHLFRKT
jgi:hypothetical protein